MPSNSLQVVLKLLSTALFLKNDQPVKYKRPALTSVSLHLA